MARMRTLKIGFFTNDQLAELPALTRLLFSGLWLLADREGRLENRPKRIKAELLPYDDCNIAEMLGQLETAGFIERYTAHEIPCIQIVNFAKHQCPNAKEAPSVLPKREQQNTLHHSGTIQNFTGEMPDTIQNFTGENLENHACQSGLALIGTGTGTVQEQEGNIIRASAREDGAFSSVETIPEEETLVSALVDLFPQLDSLRREQQAMQQECVALCLRLKMTPDKVPKWRDWLLAKWPLSNANPKKFLETLNQFLQEESNASSGRISQSGRSGNANGIPQHDAVRFDATEF